MNTSSSQRTVPHSSRGTQRGASSVRVSRRGGGGGRPDIGPAGPADGYRPVRSCRQRRRRRRRRRRHASRHSYGSGGRRSGRVSARQHRPLRRRSGLTYEVRLLSVSRAETARRPGYSYRPNPGAAAASTRRGYSRTADQAAMSHTRWSSAPGPPPSGVR